MAELTENIKRQMRYILLVLKGGKYILQKYCEKLIEGTSKSLQELIEEGKKQLKKETLCKIRGLNFDIAKFDVSLLSLVILSTFSNTISESEMDLICNIRDRRNLTTHSESYELDEKSFCREWNRLSGWFIQLSNTLSKDVQDKIQHMIKDYKILDISKYDVHGGRSELLEILSDFLSISAEAEENHQKITKLIRTLDTMKEKDYDKEVRLTLHVQMFDVNYRAHIEESVTLVINNPSGKPGSAVPSKVLSAAQEMKQGLSCHGSNQVHNATRKCISITINCPTRVGLLKLLRYIASDTFRATIQQIAMGLSEHTSEEVRITSIIAEESLNQIIAYIDGSKDIEVPEESTVCKLHGETIECFCEKHDEFCCKICTSENHRLCTLHYPGEMMSVDVAPVKKNLDATRSNILEKKSLFEKELANIKATREQQEMEISARKMELLETVNNLKTQQEECIKYYDKLEQEKSGIIGKEIASCETALREIKTVLISLELSKSKSKTIQFIAYMKCKDTIQKSKSIVEAKQQKLKDIAIHPDELKFKLDTKQIEESLQHLQKDILQYKDVQSKSIYSSSLISEGLLTETKPLRSQHATPKVAKVHVARKPVFTKKEDIKQVNVSLKDDKGPSSVRGCCTTTTGDILIADNSNRKLKRIKDRDVTDSVDLDGHPWDVCMTDTHTAVVVVYQNRIKFVNTLGKMTVSKSLTLSHNCRSLAFDTANNRLIILDQTHIYLYTKSGTMERVLYSQMPPSISLRVITVSPSCKRYCISGFDDDLIVIDESGRSRKEGKVKHITGGVCYTSDSNIFVTRKDSVSQLNDQFEVEFDFKHGITSPLSVCFNEKESKLIIGQDSDTVIIMPV